jgi:hypothetical protein
LSRPARRRFDPKAATKADQANEPRELGGRLDS